MTRWIATLVMVGACACALQACERKVFDHALALAAQDAGIGPIVAECEGAKDGVACDDRDVCTPVSSCRDGQCVAGTAFDDCTIADSAAQFSGEQGAHGWSYGYWDADADQDGSYDASTDFTPMEYCEDGAWRPPGVCGLDQSDPDFRWTQDLAWGLQHPEAEPHLELPIRRWTSDVSGPAHLFVEHRVDDPYGDGTRALLLVDGEEVWRNDARPGDTVGTRVTLALDLAPGMIVDQLVHPLASSAADTTYFAIKIEGR